MKTDDKGLVLSIQLTKDGGLEFIGPDGEYLVPNKFSPPEEDPIFQKTVQLKGYTMAANPSNRVRVVINIDGRDVCVWVDLVTWEWGYC